MLNSPAFVLMGANAIFPVFDANTKLIANVYNLNNQWSNSIPGVYQGVTFPLANNKIGLANAPALGPRRLSVAIQHDFTVGGK